jgi:lambda repressor-like predicted transcriptional regulator
MNGAPTHFDGEPARVRLLARATTNNSTLTDLVDSLRLPRRTLTRLLTGQTLRWDSADRIAIALGHHPCEIWPEWFGTSVGRHLVSKRPYDTR